MAEGFIHELRLVIMLLKTAKHLHWHIFIHEEFHWLAGAVWAATNGSISLLWSS